MRHRVLHPRVVVVFRVLNLSMPMQLVRLQINHGAENAHLT